MLKDKDIVTSDETDQKKWGPPSIARIQGIDELSTNTFPRIGNARVTSAAQNVLDYDPEAMIWQDSPSLAIMASNALKWLVIFFIWIAILSHFNHAVSEATTAEQAVIAAEAEKVAKAQQIPGKRARARQVENAKQAEASATAEARKARSDAEGIFTLILAGGALVFLFQLVRLIARAWSIGNIKYSMTSQRLKIESGIFSKASNTYELHQLGNGHVYMPFLLRLFGRSNFYASGLWLLGIKNAETVRDLIRNAGQIEASRIEKARFR